MSKFEDIYAQRRLAEAYPGLEQKAFEGFIARLKTRPDHRVNLRKLLTYLDRLVDVKRCRDVAVVGCGPQPVTVKFLLEEGFNATGVEPVESFVAAAGEYLGDARRALVGAAECLPFADQTQDILVLESVLEHVDSVQAGLGEAYRVLRPGGIAYVCTTNWQQFHPLGYTGEYRVPFFNRLPALLQECYVFHHLHYDPRLANYSQRPAVHWFCFSDLCQLGREAGFARFYALIDLMRPEDPGIQRSWFRRTMLRRIQRHPWLRALALTQLGGVIIMMKRGTASGCGSSSCVQP